jgi:hypothetical protein
LLGSAVHRNPRRRCFSYVSAWRGAFRYTLQRKSLDSPPRHTAGNSAPERFSVGDSCFDRAAVAPWPVSPLQAKTMASWVPLPRTRADRESRVRQAMGSRRIPLPGSGCLPRVPSISVNSLRQRAGETLRTGKSSGGNRRALPSPSRRPVVLAELDLDVGPRTTSRGDEAAPLQMECVLWMLRALRL